MDVELRRLVRDEIGVDAASVVRLEDGWDSIAFDVDDAWIVRVARRPEVHAALLLEASLLSVLAPELPVPVPAVRVLVDSPALVAVAHPKLHGTPISALSPANADALAAELGSFLAAVHDSRAHVEAGFPEVTAADWVTSVAAFADRCEAVLPLLERDERRRARKMFARRVATPPDYELALIHGDLGPGHILCGDFAIAGVIDWTDAGPGDPALDFAWLLHAREPSFVEQLLDAYAAGGGRIDPGFRERALYFHRVGPWHEVLFGLQTGRDELVESGLVGIRARLR
jgi:aminoglycoside phosphotransferase (APT) family kinase protein